MQKPGLCPQWHFLENFHRENKGNILTGDHGLNTVLAPQCVVVSGEFNLLKDDDDGFFLHGKARLFLFVGLRYPPI